MPKIEEFENELEENNNIEIESKTAEVPTDKNVAVEENKNTESKKEKSVEEKTDKKVDEATVIDKIKNFLAKIALMQEEVKKETTEKTSKSNKKQSKEKDEEIEEVSVEEESNEKPKYMTEYYDLPYRYNETVVKVLAQTPKKLIS